MLHVLVICFKSNYIRIPNLRKDWICHHRKHFDGFNLKQKRISSAAFMLSEWGTRNIYRSYIKIYQKLLITYQRMSPSLAYKTHQTQVKKWHPCFFGVIRKLHIFWWPQLEQKLITSYKLAHYEKENLDIIP